MRQRRRSHLAQDAAATDASGQPGVPDLDRQRSPSCDAWTICGKTPSDVEQPYSLRPPQLLSLCDAGEDARDLLRRWGVAAINTKGCKGRGDTLVGQDSFSIARLSNGWEAFCVMDGHGEDGHLPSLRAVRAILYYLETDACTELLQARSVGAALQSAFLSAQLDLEAFAKLQQFDLELSGSTATIALRNPEVEPEAVWVAHVGDSKAILFQGPDGKVLEETEDHTPVVDSERERIERMGCEVHTQEHDDGFVERRVCKAGKDWPGLCMTRSLGDMCLKQNGITAEPEVHEWSLKGRAGAYLLLASDGIWEFLKPRDASLLILDAIATGASPELALKALLKRAQELWHAEEENYCDDIVAILVPVGVTPAPRVKLESRKWSGKLKGLICGLLLSLCAVVFLRRIRMRKRLSP